MTAAMSQPERCDVCHRNFPLTGTTCHSCTAYNQDEDQEQDQGSSLRGAVPGPGCNEDGPELRRLEEAYRAGKLHPDDVQLGPLPAHAGLVMRAIAEHIQLRMGLRLAVGDDRPLPYAVGEAVRAGIAKDKATASKAICALVRAGAIEYAGSLPPTRPGIDGTKLYAPPQVEHREEAVRAQATPPSVRLVTAEDQDDGLADLPPEREDNAAKWCKCERSLPSDPDGDGLNVWCVSCARRTTWQAGGVTRRGAARSAATCGRSHG